jgi:hypothetical protein
MKTLGDVYTKSMKKSIKITENRRKSPCKMAKNDQTDL